VLLGASFESADAQNGRLTLNGDNPLTNECHSPFLDPGASVKSPLLAVSAGAYHSLALKFDGTVVGWGHNDFGEITIPASANNVVAISAGGYHSLALKANGSLVYWGLNNGGIGIPESETNVATIAAGYSYSLAIKADRTVVGWGEYYYGKFHPVTVPNNATNVVAIAAGYAHSLALKADGTVIGWGDDSYGELDAPASATNVVAIAAGSGFSLALKADGTLVAWGNNNFGQTNIPTAATNIAAIAAGGLHCLALRVDGNVVAWGWDASGETDVPSSATNVVSVSPGYYNRLVLKIDGSVIGWGGDYYGQTTIPEHLNDLAVPVLVNSDVNPNVPGFYTLTYSATNLLGVLETITRTVVVADTTPPTITCPSNLVTDATSPSGAAVSFAPTVSDNCSDAVVNCAPSSGSFFAIGDTVVYCIATDAVGNEAACRFTVHVKGAAEQIKDLIALVPRMGLPSGPANSLIAKLQAAATALDRGNLQVACGILSNFLNEVNVQTGRQLTTTQAKLLIKETPRIRAVLGC